MAAVVVVDAVSGVMVQTEKAWGYAEEFGLARMVVVNRMDRETANFERSLESIQQSLGRMCVPIQIPIGAGEGLQRRRRSGVDEGLYLCGRRYRKIHRRPPYPPTSTPRAKEYRDKLVESVAESDENLMEKFFDSGTLSDEELLSGLKKQVAEGKLYPIVYTSATANIGIPQCLNAIVNYMPDAVARGTVTGKNMQGAEVTRKIADNEPFSAFVFKTYSDPFTGRVSLFRVYSGVLSAETHPYNVNKSVAETFRADCDHAGKDARVTCQSFMPATSAPSQSLRKP